MFFYLNCGRGLNYIYGGWTNRCLISWSLCNNPKNSFSQHKAPCHASHICHRSLHARHWTHATSAFHVTAVRPVFIVTCVQSSDVSRSLRWSPYRQGWSWLIPSPCQHLSDKGAPIKAWTTCLLGLEGSVHCEGCWPATLPTPSSSSELLVEWYGLGGCEMEDRHEGGRGSSSFSNSCDA